MSHAKLDWREVPLKHLAALNPEVLTEATPPDYQLAYVDIGSVSLENGIESIEEMAFSVSPSRARRRVRHGDTIVSTVRTYLRAIAPIVDPPDNLIVSTGFAVVRPRADVNPRFLSYALRSSGFVEAVVAESVGVSYPAIAPTKLGCLGVWVGPPAEQGAIADFLDRETAKIDALIAKQKELAAILSQSRERIITDELNALVDSARASPTPLKYVAEIRGRIGYKGYTKDDIVGANEGALTIGGKHISNRGLLNLDDPEYLSWPKFHESPEIVVEEGDVLFVQRGSVGNFCVIRGLDSPATINPSVVIVRSHELVSEFLFYCLSSISAKATVGAYRSATAVPMISQEQLGCVPVLRAADDIQRAAVRVLAQRLSKVDEAIKATRGLSGKLLERRAALITAAVTGQIEVAAKIAAEAAA